MLRFLKNIIGKALSFCSSFNSFISCFKSWTFFRGDLFSPTSQPLPVPHLLFTPDSPLGEMYGRAGKRREGWHVERKVEEQRRTQGEWSMQKKKKSFTVRECRWTMPVIYYIKTAFTHTDPQSKQKTGTVFYITFIHSWFIFFVLSGMWFSRKENQQLKLGVILYTALSQQLLLSFTTHDNFATKNDVIFFFMFLVFVKVPCLLSLM